MLEVQQALNELPSVGFVSIVELEHSGGRREQLVGPRPIESPSARRKARRRRWSWTIRNSSPGVWETPCRALVVERARRGESVPTNKP